MRLRLAPPTAQFVLEIGAAGFSPAQASPSRLRAGLAGVAVAGTGRSAAARHTTGLGVASALAQQRLLIG